MIFLGGNTVFNVNSFSVRFQAILSMIPGGTDWLLWALQDGVMPPCSVNNENELLDLIQHGLHADGYIRFNTFRTQLHKILAMQAGDVELLAAVRNTADDNDTFLQPLMQRNGLLSYTALDAVSSFVSSPGFTRKDLFQSLSFNDLLLLADFSNKVPRVPSGSAKKTDAVSKAGANVKSTNANAYLFAQAGSVASVQEFIDLFLFYIHASQNLVSTSVTPAIQDSEIQVIYQQLKPLVNYLLYTPCVGSGHSEKTIRKGLAELAESNQFIGYITGPSAIRNLALNLDFSSQGNNNLQQQISNYLSVIRSLIITTPATKGVFSQDGALITFRIENEEAVALVGADEAGNIFLLPGTTVKSNTLNDNSNE